MGEKVFIVCMAILIGVPFLPIALVLLGWGLFWYILSRGGSRALRIILAVWAATIIFFIIIFFAAPFLYIFCAALELPEQTRVAAMIGFPIAYVAGLFIETIILSIRGIRRR